MPDTFEQASAVLVTIAVLAAVGAFVVVDLVRLGGSPGRTAPGRRWWTIAWSLGVAAIVMAVTRVLVLA